MTEITDLSGKDQQQLWAEVNQASAALRRCKPLDKLNNRRIGEISCASCISISLPEAPAMAAWPGPVWGVAGATSYSDFTHFEFCALLRNQLESVH